jgi:hypothetical protein
VLPSPAWSPIPTAHGSTALPCTLPVITVLRAVPHALAPPPRAAARFGDHLDGTPRALPDELRQAFRAHDLLGSDPEQWMTVPCRVIEGIANGLKGVSEHPPVHTFARVGMLDPTRNVDDVRRSTASGVVEVTSHRDGRAAWTHGERMKRAHGCEQRWRLARTGGVAALGSFR